MSVVKCGDHLKGVNRSQLVLIGSSSHSAFPVSASSADQPCPKPPAIHSADHPQKQWDPQVTAFQRALLPWAALPWHPPLLHFPASSGMLAETSLLLRFFFLNSHTPNLSGMQALTPAPSHPSTKHYFSFLRCADGFSHTLIDITLSRQGVAENAGLSSLLMEVGQMGHYDSSLFTHHLMTRCIYLGRENNKKKQTKKQLNSWWRPGCLGGHWNILQRTWNLL